MTRSIEPGSPGVNGAETLQWHAAGGSRGRVHADWLGSSMQRRIDDAPQPFSSPGTHSRIIRTIDIGLRVGWRLAGETAPFASRAGIAI